MSKQYQKASMVLFIVFMVCAFISPAIAAENPFKVTLHTKYIPTSDAKSQSGDIGVTEVHVRIKGAFNVTEDIPAEISIGGNHYLITNDVSTVLVPDSLKSRGLHGRIHFPIPIDGMEQYALGIGVNPSFQTARHADFDGSAFRMRSMAYLVYKHSESLSLEGGITHRAEYQADIFPYIGLKYKPTEEIAFKIISSESEIIAKAKYQISDKNSVFLEAAYELDEFEITDNEQGTEGKIIEYQDTSAGVGVKHRFNEHFSAAVKVGGIFKRRIEYLDNTGKIVPEAAPYVAVDLVGRF